MGSEYQREVKQSIATSDERRHLVNLEKLIYTSKKFLEEYVKNRLNKQSETLPETPKLIKIYNVGKNEDYYGRIEIDHKLEDSPDTPYPYQDSYI